LLSRLAVRFFRFRALLCIALILPTGVRDETERSGLSLAIGIAIRRSVLTEYPQVASSYFRLLLGFINKLFNTALPQGGADLLLAALRDVNESSAAFSKLATLVDFSVMASHLLRPEVKAFRVWQIRVTQICRASGSRVPKFIFCGDDFGYLDLIDLVLGALTIGIRFRETTATEHGPEEPKPHEGWISVIRMSSVVEVATGVALVRGPKPKYICVY
jgi:hypothetical protein